MGATRGPPHAVLKEPGAGGARKAAGTCGRRTDRYLQEPLLALTGNKSGKVQRVFFIALTQEDPETIEMAASDQEEPQHQRVVAGAGDEDS